MSLHVAHFVLSIYKNGNYTFIGVRKLNFELTKMTSESTGNAVCGVSQYIRTEITQLYLYNVITRKILENNQQIKTVIRNVFNCITY